MRGGGGAGSQPMSTAVLITWHGAQIKNFGDLTYVWRKFHHGKQHKLNSVFCFYGRTVRRLYWHAILFVSDSLDGVHL
jgi:hypothetical protein